MIQLSTNDIVHVNKFDDLQKLYLQTIITVSLRISGFCRSIIFFGMKNVRVGGKILGSIGNTHIFLFGLIETIFHDTNMTQ
jgi:hypothetical protein